MAEGARLARDGRATPLRPNSAGPLLLAMREGKAVGTDIEAYVEGIEVGKRAQVQALRKLVKKEQPQLREAIRWGNLSWLGNKDVCWVLVYDEHVDFGFHQGASLNDPKGLLEGTGKRLRHVKIREGKDIRPKEFAALLKQAVALDK